ncbi:MAG: hypothetical protein IIB31_10420 [Chloroflexi bacterium]|nr:hypothetical protein [Chloroflexota bacterium]
MDWFQRYGIPEEHLRLRAHDTEELAHYSLGTSDIEYLFPFGWAVPALRRYRRVYR